MKKLGVRSLKTWGEMKVAPGYLYQTLENWAPRLYYQNLEGRLFNGYKVDCDIREVVQQLIYFFGYYEAIETFWVSQILQPGQTMLDAGANLGYFSLVGAQIVGAQGQVHSFEPIPANFKRLKNHIKLNHLESVVHANNVGLWDQNEVLDFGISEETANNFGTFSVGSKDNLVNQLQCQVIKIDDYVSEKKVSKVDFLKMDVEGAELKALIGAQRTLERDRPTLLIEICKYTCDRFGYDQEEIWQLLKPLGYKMVLISNSQKASKGLESLSGLLQENVLFYQGNLPKTLLDSWDIKQVRRDFF
ncbi:MAG: FkbM family methyltransferase [Pseudomonadota bacterium]